MSTRDNPSSGQQHPRDAVAQGLIDADITQQILDRLAIGGEVGTANVSVVTNHGVVTLSGVLPTQQQKLAAERTARTVEGVVSVRNEIRVPGEGREGGYSDNVPSPSGPSQP